MGRRPPGSRRSCSFGGPGALAIERSDMHNPDEPRQARRRRLPRRRSTRLFLVAGALAIALVPAAWANDQFTDVSPASPHHDDISTIARVGVTGGCGPGLYCPTQAVQRDQMASFIARTLRALTLVFRSTAQVTGAVDIDATPIVCQTGSFTSTVAVIARVDSWVSLEAAASSLMAFTVNSAYSTNGGATWNFSPDNFASRSSADLAGAWGHANNSTLVFLPPGTTVTFGVRVGRQAGTTDASGGHCRVTAEITYNDAGASTIGS